LASTPRSASRHRDIFVVPQDVDDHSHALMFAEREQLPVSVIGGW